VRKILIWQIKKDYRYKAIILLFFGRDGVIRTHDPLHPMQVRYQAALRPDKRVIIAEPICFSLNASLVGMCCLFQQIEDFQQLASYGTELFGIGYFAVGRILFINLHAQYAAVEFVARTADSETLFVQQFAYAPDQ
jgi:hypothetical protein